MEIGDLQKIASLLRYYILLSTTKSGSGHLTSSLSPVELMAVLFFKYFRADLNNFDNPANDRLIFSKGHASPLFYSLYKVTGVITENEIKKFRNFKSNLEGHPTKRFKYTEVPTGSLGQGLSAGVGIAINGKYLDKANYKTFVLLGDGETAEGEIWEAFAIASHYKLNNLVAIIDVNRLGQSGETMLGYDVKKYEERIKSFGWRTYVINDGNNLQEVDKAFSFILSEIDKGDSPCAIIAKTVKGKGVSFMENKEGWHGKVLTDEQFKKAVLDLGNIDKNIVGKVVKPEEQDSSLSEKSKRYEPGEVVDGVQIIDGIGHRTSDVRKLTTHYSPITSHYRVGEMVSTRKAYGEALVSLGGVYKDVVVLDGDMKNSTFVEDFAKEFPDKYFEMFIAEQNMVSCAMGLATRNKVPFVSTFAAFLTRAYDQIRMAELSGEHMVICGSHSGVSIGGDGPSQMGLTDLAMFRSLINTCVLYPSDAVSTQKSVELSYLQKGIVYIRTTRPDTPVIYKKDEVFEIGKSKTLKESKNDKATVIAAGITVIESLKAYEELKKGEIDIRIIDAYSIKPLDENTIKKAARETGIIITVEDHSLIGGLGDAVLEAIAGERIRFKKLGVSKTPRSGKPEELFDYEDISFSAIVKTIKKVIGE